MDELIVDYRFRKKYQYSNVISMFSSIFNCSLPKNIEQYNTRPPFKPYFLPLTTFDNVNIYGVTQCFQLHGDHPLYT